MMKQTRMIRMSFLICTILSIASFWGGYYMGGYQLSSDVKPILTASGNEDMPDKISTSDQKRSADTTVVESMNNLKEEKYYLKVSGEYLSVYFSDTDRLYFETSLKVSELPEYLRKDALNGISFSSLENLYSFLENYSS